MLLLLESFYLQYRKLIRSMPHEELKPILEHAYKKESLIKKVNPKASKYNQLKAASLRKV